MFAPKVREAAKAGSAASAAAAQETFTRQPAAAESPFPTSGDLLPFVSLAGDDAEREADSRAAEALRGGNAAPPPSAPSLGAMPPGVPPAVAGQAGNGRPLADAAGFESRFGVPFSRVRIHDDEQAAALAEAADARAFTAGTHIFFNRGEYQPGSAEGRALLAHELAHTEQDQRGPARLFRQPKGKGVSAPHSDKNKDEWVRLQVFASGMDHAAQLMAQSKITFHGAENRQLVFVGLHPQFVKVYDQSGKALGARIKLKEVKGLVFKPGVYVEGPKGFMALTVSADDTQLGIESERSVVGQRPYTAKEKADMAAEAEKAKAEGRKPPAPAQPILDFQDMLTEPDRFRTMVHSTANPLAVYFVPTYDPSDSGKAAGEKSTLYSSPIESREDGQPANAPPWPVDMKGPKLVPVGADPTYSSTIDWSANGNTSLSSQVISAVGVTIHYKWERFDITEYAKKEAARIEAAKKKASAAAPAPEEPEKTLDERVEDFKHSERGAGEDVTGTGGARREFRREFEDWWKDTKRAAHGAANPHGDTAAEMLSNMEANRLSLELAPLSLLTTAVGAVVKLIADLFSGPRKEQEIPFEKEGVYLIRVITTPVIGEDTQGKPVIRPPSVAARVTEVTPMERAVQESLDEPGAQLAELQAQIDRAEKVEHNQAKADYLRSLLKQAQAQLQGSPLTVLENKLTEKQRELEDYHKKFPSLSTYSREHEVSLLEDQIALYKKHEERRTEGAKDLAPAQRLNATLISEVTGQQYPLLLSAGPMAKSGDQHRWMINDVTNRDGDAYIGVGETSSAAFRSALQKFGDKATYGRGKIGVRTEGLGLEPTPDKDIMVDSAPADWALAEKRIDDLVTTLALLGLFVASAGTAAVVVGAAVAAARLIERWRAGRLYLNDAATIGDIFSVLGGLGAAGTLAAGLRVQKFDKFFTILKEGEATEAQLARAAEALKGAQQAAKVVELANEAIGYGGMIWGDVSFIDQLLTINEQEASGAMTHAEARRQRAMAFSSAFQNNYIFLAGNVAKAKGKGAHAAPAEATKPGETPAPREAPPPETPRPESQHEKGAPDEGAREREQSGPREPENLPIGERPATREELEAALPADLRSMLIVDDKLHGDTVHVEYDMDPDTGLISDIRIRCSPDALPGTVGIHADTVRTMQKYQGFSGRVRLAIARIADLIGFDTIKPEDREAFKAAREVEKLPKVIKFYMDMMAKMEPNARAEAEAQLEHLQIQLDQNLRALDLGPTGEAPGYVAAEGLSKTKQKQYAKLAAELRQMTPGEDDHKAKRREMYELIGGDLEYPVWEKIYDNNVGRAKKAAEFVKAEQARLGLPDYEEPVKVGGETRRLDIADAKAKKGVEVKAYDTEKIYASEDIVWEVDRDAMLVKRGWEITWILIDTEPSGPLLEKLLDAGITVEIRTRKRGGDSRLVDVYSPLGRGKPAAAR